ncbi:MAG TPA: PhzF family phenazine biosynthesis isomerase [Jatrophihabitans sp.]|jgi:PhzF family phenazine biosynthesis protein|uniref:PhzF family phenazine biosynthesis protein n=1 Tax=Jatrophihabitans sp. TaxID=1932789 RepID=UPI002EEA9ED1
MSGAAEVAVLRLSAFALDGEGGNPAGVVLDARELSEQDMLAVAGDVGYSETVFVIDGPPVAGRRHYAVRYFSPLAEVPFCGHATVALGAALGSALGAGDLALDTAAGPVSLSTGQHPSGRWWTRLTSIAARQQPVDPAALRQALDCFDWSPDVLDPGLPPVLSYAGAWHLILGLAERRTLETMSYDFAALQGLCAEQGWTTVSLVFQLSPVEHLARNPFPAGGVVEDPATGAAAAAYGSYLAALGVVRPPARLRIEQGAQIGRPSELIVELQAGVASVAVTGTVISID